MAEYRLAATFSCSNCPNELEVAEQRGTDAQDLCRRAVAFAKDAEWHSPTRGPGATYCPTCAEALRDLKEIQIKRREERQRRARLAVLGDGVVG